MDFGHKLSAFVPLIASIIFLWCSVSNCRYGRIEWTLPCPVIFISCSSPIPYFAKLETAVARTEWLVILIFFVSMPIFLAESTIHREIWFLSTDVFLYHPFDNLFCQFEFGLKKNLRVVINLVLFSNALLNLKRKIVFKFAKFFAPSWVVFVYTELYSIRPVFTLILSFSSKKWCTQELLPLPHARPTRIQ
mgnify:FL=1